MSTPNDRKTKWGVVAALGAATLASACCTIPLMLVALGVGGAWIGTLTALEPFRPLFIALALGLLGYAGYHEWRMSRGPDCDCEVTLPDRLRRGLLVVGVIAVVGLLASPWLIGGAASAETAREGAVEAMALQEVVLKVEGMTCASCNVTVQKALTNLDGVESATVTFEPPQAVVRYDPAKVAPEDLTRATTNVGYPSKLKPSS